MGCVPQEQTLRQRLKCRKLSWEVIPERTSKGAQRKEAKRGCVNERSPLWAPVEQGLVLVGDLWGQGANPRVAPPQGGRCSIYLQPPAIVAQGCSQAPNSPAHQACPTHRPAARDSSGRAAGAQGRQLPNPRGGGVRLGRRTAWAGSSRPGTTLDLISWPFLPITPRRHSYQRRKISDFECHVCPQQNKIQ